MNYKHLVLLFFVTLSFQCSEAQKEKSDKSIIAITESAAYTLHKVENSKAVLILFGGFGQRPEQVVQEFDILSPAKENNISVVLLNIKSTLWLNNHDADSIDVIFKELFHTHHLPTDNIFLGGFSSGGNLAMLFSQYLFKNQKAYKPKGVFIVDSPIDLVALYVTSEKNIQNNFSEPSVQESSFLLKLFNNTIGNPFDNLANFEKCAVFTSQTNHIANVDALKNVKLRFYTEPDTAWWMENRKAEYDQMNAYYIKLLSETLQENGFKYVTYIPTSQKGYRSNGDRHPHSWSIVDIPNLISWMSDQ